MCCVFTGIKRYFYCKNEFLYPSAYPKEKGVLISNSYEKNTISNLAEAIKNAESLDAVGIRNALAEIQAFDTILGKFSFDANGDPIYDPVVLIVRDGNLEVFN